jgi:hypothetical protein
MGARMYASRKLGLEARRGGVQQRIWREDLGIIVALEDNPMVVSVRLDSEPRDLPPLDRPQALGKAKEPTSPMLLGRMRGPLTLKSRSWECAYVVPLSARSNSGVSSR